MPILGLFFLIFDGLIIGLGLIPYIVSQFKEPVLPADYTSYPLNINKEVQKRIREQISDFNIMTMLQSNTSSIIQALESDEVELDDGTTRRLTSITIQEMYCVGYTKHNNAQTVVVRALYSAIPSLEVIEADGPHIYTVPRETYEDFIYLSHTPNSFIWDVTSVQGSPKCIGIFSESTKESSTYMEFVPSVKVPSLIIMIWIGLPLHLLFIPAQDWLLCILFVICAIICIAPIMCKFLAMFNQSLDGVIDYVTDNTKMRINGRYPVLYWIHYMEHGRLYRTAYYSNKVSGELAEGTQLSIKHLGPFMYIHKKKDKGGKINARA